MDDKDMKIKELIEKNEILIDRMQRMQSRLKIYHDRAKILENKEAQYEKMCNDLENFVFSFTKRIRNMQGDSEYYDIVSSHDANYAKDTILALYKHLDK